MLSREMGPSLWSPVTKASRKSRWWIGLGLGVLFLLFLGALLLSGLPRLLLVGVLSKELGQPVQLQHLHWRVQSKGLDLRLQGLRIGQKFLRVQQAGIFWHWDDLWQRHWLAARVDIQQAHLEGPWPGNGSASSGGIPPLPRVLECSGCSVQWPIAHGQLQLRDLRISYQSGLGLQLHGQFRYGRHAGTLHLDFGAPRIHRPGTLHVQVEGQGESAQIIMTAIKTLSATQAQVSEIIGNIHWQETQIKLHAQDFHALHTGSGWQVATHWQLYISPLLPLLQRIAGELPQNLPRAAEISGEGRWQQNGSLTLTGLRARLGKTDLQGEIHYQPTHDLWQIQAEIPRLYLRDWLPVSARGVSATQAAIPLPALPKTWPPIRANIHIGELRWQNWQARNVHIQWRGKD